MKIVFTGSLGHIGLPLAQLLHQHELTIITSKEDRTAAIKALYLSNLLKTLTGKSTQQHIQEKIIEKAKEQLSTTGLSVSEITYGLGFDYPQSFSKLFKAKTQLAPLEFRNSFN